MVPEIRAVQLDQVESVHDYGADRAGRRCDFAALQDRARTVDVAAQKFGNFLDRPSATQAKAAEMTLP